MPRRFSVTALDRFGWYLGAAFQIQDDVLNLMGTYDRYGKEISGDLWEGKRTLMLIDFMRRSSGADRERLRGFLGQGPRRPHRCRGLLAAPAHA
jgi:geranylgeranyl diphosphate synthase, type II